jgi:hypothetical protein
MSTSSFQDKRMLLREFERLLQQVPDDREGIQETMEFFSYMMRIRSFIPPAAELVTVLKHQKPILFQLLKRAISTTSHLHLLLQMDVDYRLAMERLGFAPVGGQDEAREKEAASSEPEDAATWRNP